jgi:hypothetical protein
VPSVFGFFHIQVVPGTDRAARKDAVEAFPERLATRLPRSERCRESLGTRRCRQRYLVAKLTTSGSIMVTLHDTVYLGIGMCAHTDQLQASATWVRRLGPMQP